MTEGYKLKSESDIRAELKGLKRLRLICYGPILGAFILILISALLSKWVKIEFGPIKIMLFVGIMYGFFKRHSIRKFECPFCGKNFHTRRHGNGLLSPYSYNDLTPKCMNCGLELNGGNINSLIAVRDKGSVVLSEALGS
jgi:ribosomal protein L37AE/L43A